MENSEFHYGCLIRVKDLTKVKSFYGETLEFGSPILDSSFWVEYKLPDNGILALEQASTVHLDDDRQDVLCLVEVDDMSSLMKRLEERQVRAILPSVEVPGRETVSVKDPEGNLLTFYSRVANNS